MSISSIYTFACDSAYQFANTTHTYVNQSLETAKACAEAGLAYASNTMGPTDTYGEWLGKTAKSISENTPETVQQIVRYIGDNPLNVAGTLTGAYVTSKGLRNLFNPDMSKKVAVRQIVAGGVIAVGSSLVEGDAAWKLMQISALSAFSLGLLWKNTSVKSEAPVAEKVVSDTTKEVSDTEKKSIEGVFTAELETEFMPEINEKGH